MRRMILALALATLGLAPCAEAAPITQSVTFTASGFVPSGAPTDPVTGSVTFTYDPAVPNVLATTDSFSLTIGGTTYSTASVIGATFLVIGSNCNSSSCGVFPSTPGFFMGFSDWTTPQIALIALAYSLGDGTIYFGRQFSTALATAAVPAQLPLAVTGLLMLGVAALGRRSGARPA